MIQRVLIRNYFGFNGFIVLERDLPHRTGIPLLSVYYDGKNSPLNEPTMDIENARLVSFDIKFSRQGIMNAC